MSMEVARSNAEVPEVTNVDIFIEKNIISKLKKFYPKHSFNAEESGKKCNEKAGDEYEWVIDPIDGTAPYSAHVPLWGVSIGRMEQGVLTEGAIYMPVDDEALLTCRGTLFSARGLQSGAPEVTPFQPRRMALSPAGHLCIPQQGAKRWRFDLPNQVFAWSTCVGCYYALLHGRVLACLQSCKLWDLAGGLPVARAAGFRSWFADGRELGPEIVSSGNFHLSPGPARWRLTAPTVAAPDRETAEYVWNHVRLE